MVPIFLIFGLSKILFASKRLSNFLLPVFIAFAMGGLLGDVFFHTLPHLQPSHSHDHSNEEGGHAHDPADMYVNFLIIVGIVIFFLIEIVTQRVIGVTHSHGDHDHKDQKGHDEANERAKFQSYFLLSFIGDFSHNVTDGLAIGASFFSSYKMGVATSLAMLFHEIPHEVGDFAVLFKLKVPLYKVLGFQLLTGCGAMFGAYVSTWIGESFKNECLALTSGGFLYFSLNCLMNELKEVKGLFNLIICLGAFFCGLYFMFIFALFE